MLMLDEVSLHPQFPWLNRMMGNPLVNSSI